MSLVRNAADRQQVQRADRQLDARRKQELADLRRILALPEGRRMFWFILDQLQPRTQMWSPSAQVGFNAARHDVGTWLWDQINEADPNAELLIRQDARRWTEALKDNTKTVNDEKEKEIED